LEFCPAEQTDVDLQMKKCITYNKDEANASLAAHSEILGSTLG